VGMDIRPLTLHYAVSAQICVDDLAEIAEAGIKTVICNRPDSEVPAELHHAQIRDAAVAAGLEFVVLELTMQTLTPANIARQHALIEQADGPVLAYCRTGTRCSVVWALTQVGSMTTNDIMAAATTAGYDLSGLVPTLDQMAKDQG